MTVEWLFALIPAGLGSCFFVIGLVMIRRSRALKRSGAKAYGQVVGLATSSGRSGTLYHPVVRWVSADGRTVEQRAVIGKAWIADFRPGRQVLVHYDPGRPERMVIEGYSSGAEWLFCLVGAAVLVVTVLVCLAAVF
ncbi:DUF3592 domain-containing protein [Nocardia sp. NPDC002869]|uniref:DUF3592 domain-containing protein n=1 Tax=Nocardia sp. NPDC002869 TaxID=3161032 RepID=UPI00398D3837